MSIFDRGIRGNVQSPFNSLGDASTLGYSNPRIPQAFGGNVQLALDYFADSLYPNYKGTVATKNDLPTNAAVNDYYIVSDDGDGKSAGYVYSNLQGVTSWIKRYDVDYSAEGILAEAMDRTSYQYVSKYGSTDKDASGNPVTGDQAGQTIYGGSQAGQNLTLFANKADSSGVLNVANGLRPLSVGLDIGSVDKPFQNLNLTSNAQIGQLSVSDGYINQQGPLTIASTQSVTVNAPTSITSPLQVDGSMTIGSGSINDSSGSIDFGNANLNTSGSLGGQQLNIFGQAQIGNFSLNGDTLSNGNSIFNFNYANLSQISSIYANKLMTPEIDLGALTVTDSVIATNANVLKLDPAQTVYITKGASVAGNLGVNGDTNLQKTYVGTTLQVNAAAKVSTDANGNARIEALQNDLLFDSTGAIKFTKDLTPTTDNARSLGTTAARYKTGYFSNGLSDGTNSVSIQSLLSLRDINTNATAGMTLFYNGTEWLPSIPDSEIVHSTLSGLTTGDAGHTQFALLAGRAGGQQLNGGSGSGENLTLESTSNATKGLVCTSSTFTPTLNAGADLGTSVKQFKNIYSSGLHYNLRFEQYAGAANYPANATATIGHVIWDTSANQLLVDNGTSWSKVGNQKWQSDISADGTTLTYSVNVSASISDARTGMWQLLDNSNGFGQVYTTITKTQTTVTVTTSPALPAGSYRLVGFN